MNSKDFSDVVNKDLSKITKKKMIEMKKFYDSNTTMSSKMFATKFKIKEVTADVILDKFDMDSFVDEDLDEMIRGKN